MKYQLLGPSGLRVSEICLGAMTFGEEWGIGANLADSREVFRAYSDAGGNHRKNIVQAVEASLRRLETDYIDLYWLHMWDFTTPLEEVMRALDDLIRAGKILYVGASDAPAWIVSRANMLAELRGWTPFIALQLKYNLLERTIEREFMPMARELGLTVTSWAPLNYGILTGKYRVENGELLSSDGSNRYAPHQAGFLDERKFGILAALEKIARKNEKTMAQVALAWNRRKGALPIIGARTQEQLLENLGCLDFELSSDDFQELERVSEISLGFPHDFLHRDGIRERVFGETFRDFKDLRL